MWSLPDINRMNTEAAEQKSKLATAVETGELDGETLECEWHNHDEPSRCEGELRHYQWHDIFSDDPKGILTLCEHHDGYYGSPSEGYFECDSCNRVFIENYTWEYYRVHDEHGNTLCLPCYAEEQIAIDDNWIVLTDESIAAVTFNTVKKAKHLIGVRMPTPKGIEFVENVELDSSTGSRLTGFSSCEQSPDNGAQEIRDILTRLKDDGKKRALLILDGAYQFSVSIGVYIDQEGT